MNGAQLSEAEFRKIMQTTLDRVESAFEGVDPDLAECEQSLGSMTITFSDRSRCILSAQPSVRQLWLALAAKGTAYHFIWDGSHWNDDKGKGIELLAFLESYFGEMTGRAFRLKEGSA